MVCSLFHTAALDVGFAQGFGSQVQKKKWVNYMAKILLLLNLENEFTVLHNLHFQSMPGILAINIINPL